MTQPPSSETALAKGREAYERRAWQEAFEALCAADTATALQGEDLDRLAMAAALAGHDDLHLSTLERVHQLRLSVGENRASARAAFWIGFRLMSLGEGARANGWLVRAQRLVDAEGDCAERGLLLVPVAYRAQRSGHHRVCHDTAEEIALIGDKFNDCDLATFGRSLQGRALIRLGEVQRGMALIDESMLALVSGDVSPILTALAYCGVIATCQRVYAVERAREWTQALSSWCEAQTGVASFQGICLVHRAELLQFGGEWPEALDEARRARSVHGKGAVSESHYQEAEVHRLQGNFTDSEASFEAASLSGGDPQPGLALLRLHQGKTEAASNAIRRVLAEATDPLSRVRFLPAAVEIFAKMRDLEAARAAAQELEQTAAAFPTEVLVAIAAQARGMVHLCAGDAQAALGPLRRAFWVWQSLFAPYAAARTRVCLAEACQLLGDSEGARLERAAARAVFKELGAMPDLVSLDAIHPQALDTQPPPVPATAAHGLTLRELQVLKLLAVGKTTKQLACELFLSEKTIERHLSNIFGKLGVSSRTAAAAYAYEHHLA